MKFDSENLIQLIKPSIDKLATQVEIQLITTEQFKILHASLKKYLEDYDLSIIKSIIIKEEEINNLCVDVYDLLSASLNSKTGVDYNLVELSRELKIINVENPKQYQDSQVVLNSSLELSRNGYVVFIIQPKNLITYFVEGVIFDHSVFYTIEEYNKYEEKLGIEEFHTFCDNYQRYLMLPNISAKFFVQTSHLRNLGVQKKETDFEKKHKHCLRSSPESFFRDDLRLFIRQHLKVNFLQREVILENNDRLDILFADEYGAVYFIEVKWKGYSINRQGDEIVLYHNTPVKSIRDIKQCLRYLMELSHSNVSIKKGFLATFDARDEKYSDEAIDVETLELGDEEKSHYPKFERLKHFRVRNTNPS